MLYMSCVIVHHPVPYQPFSLSPQLSEYNRLEEQLKKTLAELEKRDKQLSANEQEVSLRLVHFILR